MQDTLEVEIQEIVDAARQYQQCLDAEALDSSSNDLRESRRTLLETLTKWKLVAAGPTEQWEQTTINVSGPLRPFRPFVNGRKPTAN